MHGYTDREHEENGHEIIYCKWQMGEEKPKVIVASKLMSATVTNKTQQWLLRVHESFNSKTFFWKGIGGKINFGIHSQHVQKSIWILSGEVLMSVWLCL